MFCSFNSPIAFDGNSIVFGEVVERRKGGDCDGKIHSDLGIPAIRLPKPARVFGAGIDLPGRMPFPCMDDVRKPVAWIRHEQHVHMIRHDHKIAE